LARASRADVHAVEAATHQDGPGEAPLVLVVDDEARVAEVVSLTLQDEGFQVATALSGNEAVDKAARLQPDIVVLDVVMPGLDGHGVMKKLHERRRVPVILLSGKGSVADRSRGLELGADDYIVKPFHPDELAARIRAVLRRSRAAFGGSNILRLGDVEVDLERRVLTRGGEPVVLSRIEWLLLQYLARNAGKVVLHNDLLSYVWGPAYQDDVQVLRVCVSRLRAKLGSASGRRGLIRTYVGVGYALQTDGVDAPGGNGSRAVEEESVPA
jgi:DNA-binding response OmpR family regulator